MLIESIVLFVSGGAAGLVVAYAGVPALLRFAPPELQSLQDTRLDLTIILFTFGISAACGLIFGLRPAFHAAAASVSESLKEGARGIAGRTASQRFRTVLTVGEIALAMVLLTGALLLIRSFQRIHEVQPGFEVKNIFVAPVQLPRAKYPEDQKALQFFDSLFERLTGTPGIEAAGAISNLLLGPLPDSDMFTIQGRPQPIVKPLTIDVVTPQLFSAMKIPLLKGRMFDSTDQANTTPVAIINATTANAYWPNSDPIGQRFAFGRGVAPDTTWYTIVGVVADTRRAGVDHPVFTESYVPMSQQPERILQIVVRSALRPEEVRAALTKALRELDRDQPLASFGSLESALNIRTASRRFVVFLLSVFAATAVVISGVGIYGLISYLVTQRRHELGIRVALGARPADVLGLIVRHVATLGGAGLVAGGLSAWVFTRALESLLFGITRLDAVSYTGAAVALVLLCLVSALGPAIMALRVDPLLALRHD